MRVLGTSATRCGKLFEDSSTGGVMTVKSFNSEVMPASDGSSAFIRDIEALVQLVHPCVVRIVEYCITTQKFPAQIRTEFVVGGSMREALPKNETKKRL
jgi:hypothetical protein